MREAVKSRINYVSKYSINYKHALLVGKHVDKAVIIKYLTIEGKKMTFD